MCGNLLIIMSQINKQNELPEILTLSDVAQYLQISERSVHRLIQANKIKKLPIGKIRINKNDLLSFVEGGAN
jgi:excisionase family DNA binding protein